MIRSKICQRSFGHTQGQKDLEAWEYCPCCGEKLKTRLCEQCKSEMDIDWIYCVKCGKGDDLRIQKKMLGNLSGKKDFGLSFEDMVSTIKDINEVNGI